MISKIWNKNRANYHPLRALSDLKIDKTDNIFMVENGVFPEKGQMGVIYVDKTNNIAKYWDGLAYQSMSINGKDGKSAYQSYLDTTTDNPKLSEAEWSKNNFGIFILNLTPDEVNFMNGLNYSGDVKFINPEKVQAMLNSFKKYNYGLNVFILDSSAPGAWRLAAYLYQETSYNDGKIVYKTDIGGGYFYEISLYIDNGIRKGRANRYSYPNYMMFYNEKQVKVTNTDGTVTTETILVKNK